MSLGTLLVALSEALNTALGDARAIALYDITEIIGGCALNNRDWLRNQNYQVSYSEIDDMIDRHTCIFQQTLQCEMEVDYR